MKTANQPHQLLCRTFLVTLLTSGLLTSCAKIDLGAKKSGGSTSTTTTTTSKTSSGGASSGSSDPSKLQAGQIPTSVAGDWKVGFQYNTSTMNSTFHIEQTGQNFKGTGTDDQNGAQFAIDQGTIANGTVKFFKKYPNSPPVEYTGKIEVQDDATYHGPYMSGDYTTAFNGKIITNIWEAQMILPDQPAAPAEQQAEAPAPAPAPGAPAPEQSRPLMQNWPVDRAPHLSGKWDVGYEYNFKTVRSSMFIEQEGDRISGHGVDLNTKEKFVIKKGWYHYPKLTLIREYVKGKNQATSTRTMAFKASVSFVNDKDYQGPYLSGKTQGGGNWEAQRVE